MNPLYIIQRQIKKANVLLVVDTSGSMTGVPGGIFRNSTEAGVDCDNGLDCRNTGAQGQCVASGDPCSVDADCRQKRCTLTGDTCLDDTECPGAPPHCSVTGEFCDDVNPCPALSGTCKSTNKACGGAGDPACASVKQCSVGAAACTADADCPNAGTCDDDAKIACAGNPNTVCPQQTYGSCSLGKGTPNFADCHSCYHCQDYCDNGAKNAKGGTSCSGDWDCYGCTQDSTYTGKYNSHRCATYQTCSKTGEACNENSDCPAAKGTCSNGSSTKCWSNSDCAVGKRPCVFPTNSCTGPVNLCVRPHGNCTISGANICQTVDNTCQVPTQTCIPGSANACAAPYPNDVCGQGGGGPPGPLKMCAIAGTVCSSTAQCTTSGDACVLATSRAVIAKRVLSKVVLNNYAIVNFGLMTFWQDDYYPYYPYSSSQQTVPFTDFHTKEVLEAASCFTQEEGPTATCTIAGVGYTKVSGSDSRYQVNTGANFIADDQGYCGLFCDTPDGNGQYMGSYYTYQTSSGGNVGSPTVFSSYNGKVATFGGSPYRYYQSNPKYYNGGAPPPIDHDNCGQTGQCGVSCGGRWNPVHTPFLDPTDNEASSVNAALKISARMEKASLGGLITYWSTPSGCTLKNGAYADNPDATTLDTARQYSAYHYMRKVKSLDPIDGTTDPVTGLACRNNYILFVTDGQANGPGDVDNSGTTICDTGACAATPLGAGCNCRAVTAAASLKADLGVKTFVVGFGGDVKTGSALAVNNNIARAGGTTTAYSAVNEQELESALQSAIFAAVAGSYSTAPSTSSTGSQGAAGVVGGKYALDSTVDFPTWKGNLTAYGVTDDVCGGTGKAPCTKWNAAQFLTFDPVTGCLPAPDETKCWYNRRVYTSNASNQVVKIEVDPSTKRLTAAKKAALHALGLGATDAEADLVARFMLGDPSMKNPAVLGAIINSTPIDVGQPGDSPLPGGHAFFLQHQSRMPLTYVGTDNGTLHAFFSETQIVAGVTYPAGSEAFAYVPPEMLETITNIYTQRGQRPHPDDHIFGLADSPKVKSLCVSGCQSGDTASWKTFLMMTDGFGGSEGFMLDVTSPVTTGGFADPPLAVAWHTGYGDSAAAFNQALGLTVSLPAFYLNKTDPLDDYGVIFASGYPVNDAESIQGKSIVRVRARDGLLLDTQTISTNNNCTQDLALLADVGTARDFAKNASNKLLAAYYGDTWGNLWRYTIVNGVSRVGPTNNFGCDQPLHFAPSVVQLDRDNPGNHPHEIYLVQATNSPIDPDTQALPASQLVVIKDLADSAGGVSTDSTFGTNGQVTLTVGNTAQICAVKVSGSTTCATPMPANARPMATPLAILKADGSGFQIISLWYAPPATCGKGKTYFNLHEVVGATVTQKTGFLVDNSPAPSPAVVGGKVVIVTDTGPVDITQSIGQTFVPAEPAMTVTVSERFRNLGWDEIN